MKVGKKLKKSMRVPLENYKVLQIDLLYFAKEAISQLMTRVLEKSKKFMRVLPVFSKEQLDNI